MPTVTPFPQSVDRIRELALRIRSVRDKMGLTQKEFSEKIGVSRSYLSEVEGNKGKPSIEMIIGVVSAFPNIRSEWLLTGGVPQFIHDDVGNGSATVEKIDREAIFNAVFQLERVKLNNEGKISTKNRSVLISMLYDSYMFAYKHALTKDGDTEARRWAMHYCKNAADNFDPQFFGEIILGCAFPLIFDEDQK